jgi:hypothetical protein
MHHGVGKGRSPVFLGGTSHAARMADQLTRMDSVETITKGGWYAGRSAGENLATTIRETNTSLKAGPSKAA